MDWISRQTTLEVSWQYRMASVQFQALLLYVDDVETIYVFLRFVFDSLIYFSLHQPYIIGVIAKDQTLPQWRTVFFISCAILILTNLVFVIWASGETQPWNDPRTMNGKSNGTIESGTENEEENSKKSLEKSDENLSDEKSSVM